MTPQERALVTELFDRLAALEKTPREPEAERLIADGVSRAPNAIYALVQTVLLQDEALNRADARIRELEGNAPAAGSFLDAARDGGVGHGGRGSVPSISSGSKWNPGRSESAPSYPAPSPNGHAPDAARGGAFGGGGSFLGTAAAAAVGVIGGSMLFNGLRNMMGDAHAQSFGGQPDSSADRSGPWGGDASRSELARDAGVNDVGSDSSRFANHGSEPSRLLDDNSGDDSQQFDDDNDFFSDSDGGFGDGGSDA
jgi:uncharacterized protein